VVFWMSGDSSARLGRDPETLLHIWERERELDWTNQVFTSNVPLSRTWLNR
jgi:hypothetical protein